MPGPYTKQYHDNFIRAIKQAMADRDMDTNQAVAQWLGVGTVTIQKIMSRAQAPTVEQGITLCVAGGFDANWLFLSEGEMTRDTTQMATQLRTLNEQIAGLSKALKAGKKG